jgi:ABC-type lipoprotein release transport system permease subunit
MVTEAIEAEVVIRDTGRASGSLGLIAWRNLWRNRRRTWLTSGGIAFAVWLLIFAISMQDGSFEVMVDNGARLMLGHAQIQHPDYQDDPRMEFTITGTPDLLAELADQPGVIAASARAQSFALVSKGERSFGAQVMGVDAYEEARWSSLPEMVGDGRYLQAPGEAVLGSVLARNLGVSVGDEIVLLGTAKEGGVAAIVANVVGLISSGMTALDRSVLQIPIDDFRAAWNMASDESHLIVFLTESVMRSGDVVAELEALGSSDGGAWRVLGWRELMPELVQTIDIKQVSTALFFGLIAIIVTFSIVNTFMMTVFERTPELGMLMAIGMKPGSIMRQLSMEAFFLALLGVAAGVILALLLLIPLAAVGMPLPAAATEVLSAYNMPDRMYPRFSMTAAIISGAIMVIGTQIAAFIPALRIRRMRPVEALRGAE